VKDHLQTAIAKTDQPLSQNVWHEVEYHLDVCRATNGAHTELAYGVKHFLGCCLQWREFNFCMATTFLPINLCNAHIICNHPVLHPAVTILAPFSDSIFHLYKKAEAYESLPRACFT
jgi:hypothetical protein